MLQHSTAWAPSQTVVRQLPPARAKCCKLCQILLVLLHAHAASRARHCWYCCMRMRAL